MEKYSYNYVKKYFEENCKGDCELLSTEYVNSSTPLIVKCKCGEITYKKFSKIVHGQHLCRKCSAKKAAKNNRLSDKKILKILEENNCEYVDGEYKNLNSKLTLKCKCGQTFIRDIAHLKRGRGTCEKCAREKTRQSKLKYNLDIAKKLLEEKGYTVLEEEYKHSLYPMRCVCKRGHEVNIKLTLFLRGESGCSICQHIEQRGENHGNYKGGESEIFELLRKKLKFWKKEVLKRDGYKCVITNKHENLEVHHLKSFVQIVNETFQELNIPHYRKLNQYTNEEIIKIEELFCKKHTTDIGITINKDVHSLFHIKYGKANNTKLQFEEFIRRYFPSIKINLSD